MYLLFPGKLYMHKLLFSLITILSCICLPAQEKKYIVNPGEKVLEAIPVLYRYPEFRLGTVALKNGTAAHVKLNHNSWYSEMQFINPGKGDTISLAEERHIAYVAIETDTFYFDETWLELMANNGTAKLAKRRLMEMTNKQKLGAMEIPGFDAIETYTKFTGSQHMKDLVAKERLTFTERFSYYFGDRFNHFSKANKKSLLNLYRSEEKKIEQWLNENKIDFSKEEDLKRLLVYLQDL